MNLRRLMAALDDRLTIFIIISVWLLSIELSFSVCRVPVFKRTPPAPVDLHPKFLCIFPARRECVESVAEPERTQLRDGNEFTPRFRPFQPGGQHVVHEWHVVQEFGCKLASPIRHRNLAVVT